MDENEFLNQIKKAYMAVQFSHPLWQLTGEEACIVFDSAADEQTDENIHAEMHAAGSIIKVIVGNEILPDDYLKQWLEGLYDRIIVHGH